VSIEAAINPIGLIAAPGQNFWWACGGKKRFFEVLAGFLALLVRPAFLGGRYY
jgi:hypothetical protein